MKKKLLFAALIAGTSVLNAQTITKDDLKWTIGNMWPSKVNNVDATSIDFTAGTGKTWDFSSYTTGTDDTIKVESSTISDLKITSDLTGDIDYKSLTGNYSLAGIVNNATDDPTSGHMGLPHVQGEAWVSASTVGGFLAVNITGTVISSGTITVPWGTYNALLVKEAITGGIPAQTTYYWETLEHGRVAAYASEKTKLMVMQSTNFTVGVSDVKASTGFSVYPNPASSVINIEGASSGTIKVLNTLGSVVAALAFDGTKTSVDVSGLSKGLYFVQLTTNDGVSTQSVVVE
ncbi:MAG: hypothetical protein ACJAZ2_000075 [Glaciecola sp.]|jgi:hypothetical protein